MDKFNEQIRDEPSRSSDLDKRIEELKRRESAREEIHGLIEDNKLTQAVSKAANHNINLFFDPEFSEEVKKQTHQLEKEISNLQEKAEKALNKANQAIDKKRVLDILTKGDEALFELDAEPIRESIEEAEASQVKDSLIEDHIKEWRIIKKFLEEHRQDVATLQKIRDTLEESRMLSPKLMEFLRGLPSTRLFGSWRLRAFQNSIRSSDDTILDKYREKLENLAATLEKGDDATLEKQLVDFQNLLSQEKGMNDFILMLLWEQIDRWQHRLSRLKSILKRLKWAERELELYQGGLPEDRTRILLSHERLRWWIYQFVLSLAGIPPEIFVAERLRSGTESDVAQYWNEVVGKLITRYLEIKDLDEETKTYTTWKNYRQELFCRVQERKKKGEEFLDRYRRIIQPNIKEEIKPRSAPGEETEQNSARLTGDETQPALTPSKPSSGEPKEREIGNSELQSGTPAPMLGHGRDKSSKRKKETSSPSSQSLRLEFGKDEYEIPKSSKSLQIKARIVNEDGELIEDSVQVSFKAEFSGDGLVSFDPPEATQKNDWVESTLSMEDRGDVFRPENIVAKASVTIEEELIEGSADIKLLADDQSNDIDNRETKENDIVNGNEVKYEITVLNEQKQECSVVTLEGTWGQEKIFAHITKVDEDESIPKGKVTFKVNSELIDICSSESEKETCQRTFESKIDQYGRAKCILKIASTPDEKKEVAMTIDYPGAEQKTLPIYIIPR